MFDPPPLKSNLDDYTRDEMYSLLMEELPLLREIAKTAHAMGVNRNGVSYTEAERRCGEAIARWQECLGSQLDAKNG